MTANAKNAPETLDLTNPRQAKEHKLQGLLEKGINPYPANFDRTHEAVDIHSKYEGLADGEETQDVVRVAGRIMAMRNNGMFIDLMDVSGRIQIFCHKDSMAEDQLELLKFFDLGDIIGAEGTMRRTPRGELSVRCTRVTMLTKSRGILPEKLHGLSDLEQRYRQRYLDLIANEESKKTLLMRSKIVRFIRDYMDDMGAVEVETPILHGIMGGASAKPFTTHHNALDADFYLRVATELPLKRLIVGGMANDVYEIGRCFRNEGISIKHNPEFTSIEAYHAYKDYFDIMDLIEDMVGAAVEHIHGTRVIPFGDNELDFSKPWARQSMCGLVQEKTGIDFLAIETAEEAIKAARDIGVRVDDNMKWGQVVAEVFDEKVEDSLIQPTHVTELPLDISPLAKVHRDNPRLVERFETFVNGWEIANAFSELNDPKIQYERFMEQVAQGAAGDEEAQMLDEDYVTALEVGLPPTGGWGLGIDRFVMLLTNSHNIRDVICFPTLKPKKLTQPSLKNNAPLELDGKTSSEKDYKLIDETSRKFVLIVNDKEKDMGRIMNALGHSMAGLAGNLAKKDDMCFIDYKDADGNIHPSISHFPVIVLKAKNSNKIKAIREQAIEKNVAFTDFTDTMTVGSTSDQLTATENHAADDLNYLGMCLFGESTTLNELTGKLSLYK